MSLCDELHEPLQSMLNLVHTSDRGRDSEGDGSYQSCVQVRNDCNTMEADMETSFQYIVVLTTFKMVYIVDSLVLFVIREEGTFNRI